MNFLERIPKPVVTSAKVALTVAILLSILVATGLMRFPILDNVICDPDVGGAAYSSQFFFSEGSVYAHGIETKPPLTYLLFNLLFRFFGRSMFVISVFSVFYHIA